MLNTEPTARDLFFKALKTKTAPQHDALEQTPLAMCIVREDLQLSQYISYLKTMYAFVKPFERNYYPVLTSVFPNIKERSRIAALESDLLQLGLSTEELAAIELLQFQADIALPEAVGAMYVLEGSTLGGRVILKNVDKTLGLDAANGAQYFHGYGAETGPKWKEFLDNLWTFAAGSDEQEQIFKGAQRTFSALHGLFDKKEIHAV